MIGELERPAEAAVPSGRKLSIIFLTITFDPEPGAQHGLPLARWMKNRGHDVKVLTCFPQYPIGRIYDGYKQSFRMWDELDGVPILRVPIYPSHDTSGLRRFFTYTSFMLSASLIGVPSIGKADVVFLYEPPPTNGIASALLKLFRGTPIVHHIADMWPDTVIHSGMVNSEFGKKVVEKVVGGYCKWLYRIAYRVSVLSPGSKRILLSRGVPEEKVKVVYNWCDESLFRPVPRDEALLRELGMDGKFNFVYAGNVGVMQDLTTVVRAASLVQDLRDLQVVIIGTGPKLEDVKAAAKECGAANVRFVDRRPYSEMPKINALSDVQIAHLVDLQFQHANVPSKAIVSMACGNPILMAVRGDSLDLVLEAGAGIECKPEDPEAMAAVMRKMYLMPRDELRAMGERGRRFYEERLSLNVSAAKMEQMFLGAAASRKR